MSTSVTSISMSFFLSLYISICNFNLYVFLSLPLYLHKYSSPLSSVHLYFSSLYLHCLSMFSSIFVFIYVDCTVILFLLPSSLFITPLYQTRTPPLFYTLILPALLSILIFLCPSLLSFSLFSSFFVLFFPPIFLTSFLLQSLLPAFLLFSSLPSLLFPAYILIQHPDGCWGAY